MKDKQREIKFRAWDIHKGMFISSDVWAIINQPDGREQAIMLSDWEDYIVGECFYPENQVIMQYTGLKDKDDTRIYEGDVLIDVRDGKLIGVVEYQLDEASYCAIHPKEEWQYALSSEESDIYKVVGNTWENPELLK